MPAPLTRRLLSAALDAPLLLLVPIVWWHWAQWMSLTRTFGRLWPAWLAFAVMTVLPITVVWLEGATGRGFGHRLTGLRVERADGGPPSLGRSLLRSALKWSPLWVGPAVRLFELTIATKTLRPQWADDFSGLLAVETMSTSDSLGRGLAGIIWAANVAASGMSLGAIPLAVLAAGEAMLLVTGQRDRSLLDRVAGTRVVGGKTPMPVIPVGPGVPA
ncbi:MAG TPA: RDD family protein [Humisphaera sp.]